MRARSMAAHLRSDCCAATNPCGALSKGIGHQDQSNPWLRWDTHAHYERVNRQIITRVCCLLQVRHTLRALMSREQCWPGAVLTLGCMSKKWEVPWPGSGWCPSLQVHTWSAHCHATCEHEQSLQMKVLSVHQLV